MITVLSLAVLLFFSLSGTRSLFTALEDNPFYADANPEKITTTITFHLLVVGLILMRCFSVFGKSTFARWTEQTAWLALIMTLYAWIAWSAGSPLGPLKQNIGFSVDYGGPTFFLNAVPRYLQILSLYFVLSPLRRLVTLIVSIVDVRCKLS